MNSILFYVILIAGIILCIIGFARKQKRKIETHPRNRWNAFAYQRCTDPVINHFLEDMQVRMTFTNIQPIVIRQDLLKRMNYDFEISGRDSSFFNYCEKIPVGESQSYRGHAFMLATGRVVIFLNRASKKFPPLVYTYGNLDQGTIFFVVHSFFKVLIATQSPHGYVRVL